MDLVRDASRRSQSSSRFRGGLNHFFLGFSSHRKRGGGESAFGFGFASARSGTHGRLAAAGGSWPFKDDPADRTAPRAPGRIGTPGPPDTTAGAQRNAAR
nr:unnamed protein product [Digitaria exilis]